MKETIFAPSPEIRVLLVNSNQLYARSLQLLFEQEFNRPDFRLSIVQHLGPEEILKHVSLEIVLADLILLCCVPGNFGLTLQAAHILRSRWRNTPMLWLDVPDDPYKIKSCIRSGARGFTLENAAPAELEEALRRAAQGEPVCPAKALPYLFEQCLASEPDHAAVLPFAPHTAPGFSEGLTRREQEVLTALAEGLTNREIANRLQIELQTVKNYVHNILGKLQISNRHDAALLARRPSNWRSEKVG